MGYVLRNIELNERRKALGLSEQALADASGVSRGTVINVLKDPSGSTLENVLKIMAVLGIKLEATPVARPEEIRRRQAMAKAKKLVRLVQGTSALEGQGVGPAKLKAMVRDTAEDLLRGPKRRLWA